MNNFSFNWNGLSFPIHPATIDYLGGVPSSLEWDMRDEGFHRVDEQKQAALMQAREVARCYLETAEGQKKRDDFFGETIQVFSQLLSGDPDFLVKYLGPKKFIFVIGAMRTGGTYLYRELCRVHGVDHRAYNKTMSHDGIPTGTFLYESHDLRRMTLLVFEMSQYLVWLKREQSKQRTIIQKRIAYGHAMSFLESVLGQAAQEAEYIVTVRHPLCLGHSFARLEGVDPDASDPLTPPDWKAIVQRERNISEQAYRDLSFFERVLVYWAKYYKDVVRDAPYWGKVTVLVYGQAFEDFVARRAGMNGNPLLPTPFQVSLQEPILKPVQVDCDQVINEVRAFWLSHGFMLPEIPFC